MSLILKGIDLPNSGEIELIIRPYGKVLSNTRGIYAEAIQIPKGSRLIDANALSKEVEIEIEEFLTESGIRSAIRNAPTILESEVMPNE